MSSPRGLRAVLAWKSTIISVSTCCFTWLIYFSTIWHENLYAPTFKFHFLFLRCTIISSREVVGPYTVQVRKLASKILELIGEGLGFRPGYFAEYSKKPMLLANHYPPCPDPSLTLGLPEHCDPSLITIVHQGDVPGLQVFNNGEWFVVEPLPHAFVVNLGYVLQVSSRAFYFFLP